MNPSELEGESYGPRPMRVSADSVADFVQVTGQDPELWHDSAPPGFAAAALFVVAPELLDRVSDRFVVHGEQTFSWQGPLKVGSLVDVTGRVSRVRERGGSHFVVFDIAAEEEGQPVLRGSSLFILSGESILGDADFERPEPEHAYRGDPSPGQVAASRADLIRYAAATRDWNPVHWDHAAAVAAGFPGVVVHGLLQGAWAFAAVNGHIARSRPLVSAKLRFRNPMLPARPADVEVSTSENIATVVISDEDKEYMTGRIEMAHG